jgi:hypothetical protein
VLLLASWHLIPDYDKHEKLSTEERGGDGRAGGGRKGVADDHVVVVVVVVVVGTPESYQEKVRIGASKN